MARWNRNLTSKSLGDIAAEVLTNFAQEHFVEPLDSYILDASDLKDLLVVMGASTTEDTINTLLQRGLITKGVKLL